MGPNLRYKGAQLGIERSRPPGHPQQKLRVFLGKQALVRLLLRPGQGGVGFLHEGEKQQIKLPKPPAAAPVQARCVQGGILRRGVVIGSGIGGILTIEEGYRKLLKTGPRKISPFVVPKLMVNACAGNVSIRHHLKGANSATATACATGGHAIGTAFHLIQRGLADVMFAGGTEAAVSPLCIGSFAAMKALSTRNDDPKGASRPFDRDRDGFVLAEGGAVLILEDLEHARKRGARIYAEVLAFGSSGDASHIAAPDEEGSGAASAMRAALAEAEIAPDAIDYINAHGTSTPLGDAAEVQAVKRLFGDHAKRVVMSSTKSMTGHCLGAAGGIESVATVLALHEGVVPPTINLDEPDDEFDLDFAANTAQERPLRFAINNSFGFGGHNVSLLILATADRSAARPAVVGRMASP